jgi:DNA helicase HerA-like ATPase
MKKIWLLLVLCFGSTLVFCQIATFDLLKFHIPNAWSQQSRLDRVAYMGTEVETNSPIEIVVYRSQTAAPKIDSSFRLEWRRVFEEGNPVGAVPVPKKRYSSNSLQYAENGMELQAGSKKQYAHLFVFSANNKIQSIQISTTKLSSYKAVKMFVDDFLDSVDVLVKQVEQ